MIRYSQGTPNSDVTYEATGNEAGLEYFQVHPVTGEVSVRQTLLTSTRRNFRVSLFIRLNNVKEAVSFVTVIDQSEDYCKVKVNIIRGSPKWPFGRMSLWKVAIRGGGA